VRRLQATNGEEVLAMKLLVLGATGRTGRELLAGALRQRHEVTGLTRDPGRLTVQDERIRVLVGSATNPSMVEEAVAGRDAVLCALGPSSARELVRSELMRATVPALVSSMERNGVRRLILLSALGVGESARHAPWVARFAFGTILRRIGKDKEHAEDAVRASNLEWTIVYPPSLSDGRATGGYRHGESLKLSGSPRMSRTDVAHLMLAQPTDDRYVRKGAIVGP
jgi:putative NADH-flavin reductase